MRLQLRDSWRSCVRCGKRMVIDPLEEEGQRIVTHFCLECPYSERAAGERPRKTDSPYMAEIRRKAWAE